MKTCIIIPTYNERQNIGLLIEELVKVFHNLGHDMSILVADDESPDGTADEVRTLMKSHKNIHLLQGKKHGLGAAYVRAFKHVLDHMDMDAIIMMDADLSHPPSLIPKFMLKLEQGYDFVIGSRYVQGGDTPDWKHHRKLISRFGNIFARFIGGLHHVKDCTSGYRAIKTSLLRKIDMSNIPTKGYAFMSSLLFEATECNARFAEIPLVFYDRKHGHTKLTHSDIVEFFLNTFRMRMKKSRKLADYLSKRASGWLIGLSIIYILVSVMHLDKTILSPAICCEMTTIWDFQMNEQWVFKGTHKKDTAGVRFIIYQIACVSGIILTLLVHNLMMDAPAVSPFAGYSYLPSMLVGYIAGAAWNYMINVDWPWS